MIDKEVLAEMARKNAEEILSSIGPSTPYYHATILVAIADSWNNFARMLEI